MEHHDAAPVPAGRRLLERTAKLAGDFLEGLPARGVAAAAGGDAMRTALGGDLPATGEDPLTVVERLAGACDPGLVASAGPRYFGFVVGGSLPAALAADWLVSTWDQNAGLFVLGPAAAVAEDVAAGWILNLLGLPAGASVGFVTGCQMANFTALAAARHSVLAAAGWNVEDEGLAGAPPINVVVGEEAHVTIFSSLRMLGLGARRAVPVAADGQGRMRPDSLAQTLRRLEGPTIVCAQAGNVNSGAFDPLDEIADLAHAQGAWLHVDGAFGLWAAASPGRRALLNGVEKADSWATDAHKWLNVPYDSGLAIVRDPAAHRAPITLRADYLVKGEERDAADWVPESSRRARGIPVYAALRSLGRAGVAALVDRCCALAARMAASLAEGPGVRILNDVVLNQVLVRFEAETPAASDALTRAVIARVQRDGVCWMGGTRWHGQEAMRVSVSTWSTTEADIDRSADAVLRGLQAVSQQPSAIGNR
jgi:glutamate/tyrosine decarboxylase-like PLP-dependent enzyme